MKKISLTPEQEEWIWNKWNEGYRQKDIAEAVGRHIATVYRCIGRWQDKGRTRASNNKTYLQLGELKWKS